MRNKILIMLGILFVLGTGAAMSASICSARTPQQAVEIGQAEWKTQISAPLTLTSAAPTHSSTPISTSNSYRLRRIAIDRVLHRRWAFVENCSHPEAPLQVIALPVNPTAATAGKFFAARMAAISHGPSSFPSLGTSVDASEDTQRALPSSAARSLTNISALVSSATGDPSNPVLVRAGDRVHLWSSAANVRLEIEVVALEYGRAGQVIHFRREGQQALLAGVVVGRDSAELMP
ncbi:MAG: flagella basal body P-ring formation protein FlgA [Acidobacteriaceae bacterium]|jgi:hypothetical protein